jgi:hypothetical protein
MSNHDESKRSRQTHLNHVAVDDFAQAHSDREPNAAYPLSRLSRRFMKRREHLAECGRRIFHQTSARLGQGHAVQTLRRWLLMVKYSLTARSHPGC